MSADVITCINVFMDIDGFKHIVGMEGNGHQ